MAKIYRARATVQAMQVLLGSTTKSEIQAFCPGANVGTPDGDDLDLRWICIPAIDGGIREAMETDWIVRNNDTFNVYVDAAFRVLFEEVTQ